MVFQVAEECQKLGLRAGAVIFRDVRVGNRTPALQAEIDKEMARILTKYPTSQAVRTIAEVACFQEILRKVGVNPRKVQPSVERLLNFARQRSGLPAVNNFVDAYNLVSLRSLCSLGAHDLDRLALPATLRILTGRETFTPLGRERETPLTPGEFGYVDAAQRVLCRLDVLQAEFSKITSATVNALLIIEGVSAHGPEVLRQTFTDAIEAVTQTCGGTAAIVARPYP